MNEFVASSLSVVSLLLVALIGTVVWGVILTRQIKDAPNLSTVGGVKGTARITKQATPVLLALIIGSFMSLLFSLSWSGYVILCLFVILAAFYYIIFLVSRDKIAAERSRVSTGRSTWRGKRALRWARESVIGVGLIYALCLTLLLVIM